MSKRVESELYYVTFDMFVADVRRMFANARTYNSPETIYYKCATRQVYYSLMLQISFFYFHFHLFLNRFMHPLTGLNHISQTKFKLVYSLASRFSRKFLISNLWGWFWFKWLLLNLVIIDALSYHPIPGWYESICIICTLSRCIIVNLF